MCLYIVNGKNRKSQNLFSFNHTTRNDVNLSSLSFRHAVELDMLIGIISDTMQIDRDDLKRRRTQSVKNVKQTNGRISLEKRAQLWDEDDWSDDEWQS